MLVRHGETQWNVEQRLQGQLVPGPGLTERGRQQAAVLASRLQREPFDMIYSSDLLRATQTADIVASALLRSSPSSHCTNARGCDVCTDGTFAARSASGCTHSRQQAAAAAAAAARAGNEETSPAVAVQLDPRLRERHLGVLQGLTRAEAAAQHPGAYLGLSEPVSPGMTVSGAACEV